MLKLHQWVIYCQAWALAGMGKRGHLSPSGNVMNCFCVLVITAKRSVYELFMHYFHNPPSACGSFVRRPYIEPARWLLLQTGNLLTPVKKSCGRPCWRGGYVLPFLCLFVRLLATVCENYWWELRENFASHYLWTGKNGLNFRSHAPADPDPGFFEGFFNVARWAFHP